MTASSRVKFLLLIMVSMIICSTVTAWGDDEDEDEDEDEGRGWRGGYGNRGWGRGYGDDDDDDWDGRRLLAVQPSAFAKLLTAAGMGRFVETPVVNTPVLSFKNDNKVLEVVETSEAYKVHVKVPGFTSKDSVTAGFEDDKLVIQGKLAKDSTICSLGRKLAEVNGCSQKVSSTFRHSLGWPTQITSPVIVGIKSGILTVSIPKTDQSHVSD